MNIKKDKLYKKIFEQGLIYESDADELSKSLMTLFEEEISKKQNKLKKLNSKKESLSKNLSSEEEE
ncbi:hypothetical protein ACFSTE_02530 [Aquimarina hainanensis]|uniref:Uncharacterized protein n=1 Tax=Aquimarina hainanensis TaxID=1578017 RepID=A0ABW5N659_9FLAO|nr:hypothetical protein [Aquimarina sp. TRL1]QKX04152.1 hypothetical protein HN014_04260 [Aquimarina sp. TRL1]